MKGRLTVIRWDSSPDDNKLKCLIVITRWYIKTNFND